MKMATNSCPPCIHTLLQPDADISPLSKSGLLLHSLNLGMAMCLALAKGT